MTRRCAHGGDLRKGRYSEPGRIYFITFCCQNRERVFVNARLARVLSAEFWYEEAEEDCASLAFVIMPDHVHWLLRLQGVPALGLGLAWGG